MNIVEPKVEFNWITPNAIQEIERAGRVAYKSEDRITDTSAEAFIKGILKRGHEAVIEHASASLKFTCDRGVTHEIVRHRIFSFVQESTRFCNYSLGKFNNETKVIQPPFVSKNFVESKRIWDATITAVERGYFELLANGETAQVARSVLANCLKAEITVTGNFREWRHFFNLRTAKDAHPQMIEVATMALEILHEKVPIIFDQYWDGIQLRRNEQTQDRQQSKV